MQTDSLSAGVIGAAIEVHRALGPGLLESIYSTCLAIELEERGIRVQREVAIPVTYRGLRLEPSYRVDMIVENALVVEIKSATRIEPVFKAQLLTYMRLTDLRRGLLLNFGQTVLKDGITRMVL
jgi:GxxExxY protein